jgi:hypothetical protein
MKELVYTLVLTGMLLLGIAIGRLIIEHSESHQQGLECLRASGGEP